MTEAVAIALTTLPSRKVESEDEFRVTFKFAASKGPDLEAWVHARHPYAVPQWLTFTADHASPAYRAWVLGVR